MKNGKVIDLVKLEFVKKNIEAFVLAYLEKAAGNHLRNKHKGQQTEYSKFIHLIRTNFRYSEKTNDVDIWNKFLFKEIVDKIKDALDLRKILLGA